MINHYFGWLQAKGKGRETMQKEGKLKNMGEFDKCFKNAESSNVECLIGSTFF